MVIATYNGEQFIGDQISSILDQIGEHDEIIVSDDHSNDRTIELIESFSDSRITIVVPKRRLGPIRNFEHALRYTTKQVVVMSDQDDVWLPGRVDEIKQYFMQSNSPVDLLVLNSRVVNGELRTISPSLFDLLGCGSGLLKNVYRNTYVGCHMAFTRSLLFAALPFPSRIPMHDVWLGLIAELTGVVSFRPKITMLFRRSGYNYTKPRYGWMTRITWRAFLLMGLLRFVIFRRRSVVTLTRGRS